MYTKIYETPMKKRRYKYIYVYPNVLSTIIDALTHIKQLTLSIQLSHFLYLDSPSFFLFPQLSIYFLVALLVPNHFHSLHKHIYEHIESCAQYSRLGVYRL